MIISISCVVFIVEYQFIHICLLVIQQTVSPFVCGGDEFPFLAAAYPWTDDDDDDVSGSRQCHAWAELGWAQQQQ